MIATPGSGAVNTLRGAGDVNDYLFATNSDPGNRNLTDTLFVLDSAAGSAFRLDLPAGVTGFSGVQPVPELSSLVAIASNQVPGDAGLVFFDLQNEQQRFFPVPEGFQTVQLLDVFVNTRKLIARGIKTAASGTQYLIYDLITGDLTIPENPEGVAFVGPLPAAPTGPGGPGGGLGGGPGGGGFPGGGLPGGGLGGGGLGGGAVERPVVQVTAAQAVNLKSNTIIALAFNAQRQRVGVVAIRVP
jgi:hypothetical protein